MQYSSMATQTVLSKMRTQLNQSTTVSRQTEHENLHNRKIHGRSDV